MISISTFSPYTVYRVAYPFLKPGYIVKIGDKYYMVITARNNRKKVYFNTAKTKTELDTNTTDDNSVKLTDMAGELNVNRIVHIQYVGIDASTPTFYWGVEPLLSKDVEETLDTVRAGVSNPISIDRWSYTVEMHLLLTQTATAINYYFEIMEYEVTPYTGVPDRPYLQIMANGQAIMVEAAETEETLARLQAAQMRAKR